MISIQQIVQFHCLQIIRIYKQTIIRSHRFHSRSPIFFLQCVFSRLGLTKNKSRQVLLHAVITRLPHKIWVKKKPGQIAALIRKSFFVKRSHYISIKNPLHKQIDTVMWSFYKFYRQKLFFLLTRSIFFIGKSFILWSAKAGRSSTVYM